MNWFRRQAPALVLLICGTLLLTRIGGDHLHLCLDGQEPAVELHGEDGGLHHLGAQAGQSHDDRDIDLQTGTTLKSKGDPLSALLPVLSVLEVLTPNILVRWVSAPRAAAAFASLRHLRPPLRGPPR
jgi:hypothetical protein